MKNLFIFVVILISVQIITTFSIANKLSIGNLTTTPVLKISGNESERNMHINKNSHNSNDSITANESRSGIIDRPEVHHMAITSGGHVPSIILTQRKPQKRSFFGFIIIPCK